MLHNFLTSLRSILIAMILSIGISYAYATWAPPTQTPPSGNIDVPVNVGNTSQTKQGDLSSNSFMSAVQGLFGSVGIGTLSIPASVKLDVTGNVGADAYCDRNGGNCISGSSAGIKFPDGSTQSTASNGGGVTKNPAVYLCPATPSNACNGTCFITEFSLNSSCTYYNKGLNGICITSSPVTVSCSFLGDLVQP